MIPQCYSLGEIFIGISLGWLLGSLFMGLWWICSTSTKG
jgi:hypothetical protein